MKKKELKEKVEGLRKISNTLTGTAKDFADAVVAAFDEAANAEEEHEITDLKNKVDEIAAQFDKQGEEVEAKIARVKQDMMRQIAGGKVENAASKITKAVKEQICNAILEGGKAHAKDRVMQVLKQNGIEGLDFPTVLRIAVEFESKPTELFDAFSRTELDKVFLIGIDEEDAEQIAKQHSGDPEVEKELQELTAEGVTINTKYIYKMQRFANEALDNAREAGTLAQVESETSRELENMVKRLAEKAAIVGDNKNASGKKVTTFETIGAVKESNLRVTVVNPATANTVTIVDIAKAADKVDAPVSEKVAVLSKDLARELSVFVYANGGTPTILSDEELAAQIGVARIVKVDYLSEVAGLHAVVLKPSAYKVRVKNEQRVAFPEWRKNAQYFLYEMNMGGALMELKSAAVLRETESTAE